MAEKSYTRDEYVYLAKLYERAEKFDGMVKWIGKYVEIDPNLSLDVFNADNTFGLIAHKQLNRTLWSELRLMLRPLLSIYGNDSLFTRMSSVLSPSSV